MVDANKDTQKSANQRVVMSASMGISMISGGILLFSIANYGGRRATNAAPPRLETPQETKLAEAFQKAGRTGDASQTQVMIQTLQQQPQEYAATSAMHSLALLGATEAIPVLDQYIHGNLSTAYGYGAPYIAAEAKVAKAHLLAEDAGKNVTTPASQADVKTRKFFEVLGLSPAQLNTGVTEYFKHGPEEMNEPAPLELKALRELADIAYQGACKNFTSLPTASGVNFASDALSNLKVQLAPLPHASRAVWLIHDLAQTKPVPRGAFLSQSKADEERLAIAEGLPASDAAASMLQHMDTRHRQYSSIAFATLFDILEGVGDKKRDALLLHFSHDADPYIAQQAFNSHRMLNAKSE